MSMVDTPPEIDKTPAKCDVCDITVTLGLLTSMCESSDPAKKGKCLEIIKPLEHGSVSPAEALKNAIVILGEDDLNGTLDRMNMLIYDATDRAKRELIEKKVLNADGTRREG